MVKDFGRPGRAFGQSERHVAHDRLAHPWACRPGEARGAPYWRAARRPGRASGPGRPGAARPRGSSGWAPGAGVGTGAAVVAAGGGAAVVAAVAAAVAGGRRGDGGELVLGRVRLGRGGRRRPSRCCPTTTPATRRARGRPPRRTPGPRRARLRLLRVRDVEVDRHGRPRLRRRGGADVELGRLGALRGRGGGRRGDRRGRRRRRRRATGCGTPAAAGGGAMPSIVAPGFGGDVPGLRGGRDVLRRDAAVDDDRVLRLARRRGNRRRVRPVRRVCARLRPWRERRRAFRRPGARGGRPPTAPRAR